VSKLTPSQADGEETRWREKKQFKSADALGNSGGQKPTEQGTRGEAHAKMGEKKKRGGREGQKGGGKRPRCARSAKGAERKRTRNVRLQCDLSSPRTPRKKKKKKTTRREKEGNWGKAWEKSSHGAMENGCPRKVPSLGQKAAKKEEQKKSERNL